MAMTKAEIKLIEAIDTLRYENAQYHTVNFSEQEKQTKNTESLNKTVGEFLAEFKKSRVEGQKDAEEDRLENKDKTPPAPIRPERDKSDLPSFELKGILAILAGIGASIAGFAVGLVQGFGNIVKLATKAFRARISGMFAPFSRFVDAISDIFGKRGTGQIFKGSTYKTLGRLSGVFRSFSDIIKGLEIRFAGTLKNLKNFGTSVKSFAVTIANTVKGVAQLGIDRLLTTIRSGMTSISSFFKSVAGFGNFADVRKSLPDLKAFRALKDTLSAKIVTPFKNFINGIRGVGQSTSTLGKTLARFFGAFKVIGRFVAFPLTIIMGIIDGFKGLLKGAERQEGMFNKLLGGAIGAITGVLKGLVAMPLDLLKDGISWIAGKLGFKNFEKMLDSFSFGEMFQFVGDNLADNFVRFFSEIGESLSNSFNSLMEPFKDGFSLGGLFEFIVTLPSKLSAGLLDLTLEMFESLFRLFNMNDAAQALDNFSVTDTLQSFINYIFGLPGKLLDGIVSLFEGFSIYDALSAMGDFVTAVENQMRKLILSILPDPDSLLAKVIPDGLYEWAGTPVSEPKMVADASNQKMDNRVEPVEDKSQATETEERLSRANSTPQTSRGQELSDKSKENALSSGVSVNVVNAPTSQSVTNNSQSTAAIMDKNMPTVDYNDRTWAFG
jgi:hypothetical protein